MCFIILCYTILYSAATYKITVLDMNQSNISYLLIETSLIFHI